MTMASDTLSISKDLRAAGFDEHQAEVLATHMAATPADVATKTDLALLESRLDRKIDRLLLKLGGGLAVGFGLVLAAIGIATTLLLNQPG